MKKISTKPVPFLRVIAAGMLLLWFVAVGTCSTQCSGDDCQSVSAARGQPANGRPHNAHKQGCPDDSLCDSLHSICPATPNQTLIKPDFGPVFALDFVAPTQSIQYPQRGIVVFRQMPHAGGLFLPEVCPGPALHSLAPPIPA